MLSLFCAAIYIFGLMPVLELLSCIMLFWCIFSVLYYFRRAILLIVGLMIVAISARFVWDEVVDIRGY